MEIAPLLGPKNSDDLALKICNSTLDDACSNTSKIMQSLQPVGPLDELLNTSNSSYGWQNSTTGSYEVHPLRPCLLSVVAELAAADD